MSFEKRELGERELSTLWQAARTLYESLYRSPSHVPWNNLSDAEQKRYFEYARVTTRSFRLQLHLAEMSSSSLQIALAKMKKLAQNRLAKMRLLRLKVSGFELSNEQERMLK